MRPVPRCGFMPLVKVGIVKNSTLTVDAKANETYLQCIRNGLQPVQPRFDKATNASRQLTLTQALIVRRGMSVMEGVSPPGNLTSHSGMAASIGKPKQGWHPWSDSRRPMLVGKPSGILPACGRGHCRSLLLPVHSGFCQEVLPIGAVTRGEIFVSSLPYLVFDYLVHDARPHCSASLGGVCPSQVPVPVGRFQMLRHKCRTDVGQ